MTQDYGIKTSRLGYDVLKASKRELAMSSEFNFMKIHASGTISITGTSVDIAHGLGYKPAFACWYGYPPQTAIIYPVPNKLDVWMANIAAWIGPTYLHIEISGKVENPLIVYYIYKEELT